MIETEDETECQLDIFNEESSVGVPFEFLKTNEILAIPKKYKKRYLGDYLIFAIRCGYVETGKPIYVSFIPDMMGS